MIQNLYGWAMSQPVPIDDFQWANCDDWTAETIRSLDSEAETSYMFEVDLEIPEAIHDRYFTFSNSGPSKNHVHCLSSSN